MARYLLMYHVEKLIIWFLLTPVVAGLLVMPFTLFHEDVAIFLFPVLAATTLVLTFFLEQTVVYQQMLRAMPIPPRTFVHVKFLFSTLILAYQFMLLTLFLSNRAGEILLPFLLTALTLCLLLTNSLLLYHFYTGQQKQMAMLAVIFILPPLLGIQQVDSLMLTNESAIIVLPITLIITYFNYRLCLYFAKTKDA